MSAMLDYFQGKSGFEYLELELLRQEAEQTNDFSDRIPISKWGDDRDLSVALTPGQTAFVLSGLPNGSKILFSHYFDNYDLPCPIKVVCLLSDGTEKAIVLRSTRRGDLSLEAEALKVRKEIEKSKEKKKRKRIREKGTKTQTKEKERKKDTF